jgi:hypothetical protein
MKLTENAAYARSMGLTVRELNRKDAQEVKSYGLRPTRAPKKRDEKEAERAMDEGRRARTKAARKLARAMLGELVQDAERRFYG